VLLTLSRWSHDSTVGIAVRDSLWLFPAIEGVHLLALALLGGAVLLVDLRLLGFGLEQQQARELERLMRPWMVGGLVAMGLSGAVMWASGARGYYTNAPFRLKMLALVLAVAFSLIVKPRLIGPERRGTAGQRVAAMLSLALWTAVGIAGRGIGFW